MSGTSIPYHLRPNKAIDRYAFIELLGKINRFSPIDQYQYIGFGGHSLEDFKYIHSQFGINSMISLEQDKETFKRQKFNLPYSCIDCQQMKSSDFINDFSRKQPTIIWLDYVKPSELRSQIEEFQAVISKLEALDILKITLNANPSAYLQGKPEMGSDEITRLRLEKLQNRLGDLFPSANITQEMMKFKQFSKAILLILQYAKNLILEGEKELNFQPLTAFSYADGQQMMTLTGILLNNADIEQFFQTTTINNDWPLANTNWQSPKSVNIPDLTIKERLFIDSQLPDSDVQDIHNALGFLFNKKSSISLEMLETYCLFYRYSPYFSRIIL